MKTEPETTVACLLCGLRGTEIAMPRQAAEDCSAPGQPADESVAYWSGRITRPDTLTPELLRECLREYGAWDSEELADDAQNWGRAIWVSACNWREDEARKTRYDIHDSKTGEWIREIAVGEDEASEIETLSGDTEEGHFRADRVEALRDLGAASVYAVEGGGL